MKTATPLPSLTADNFLCMPANTVIISGEIDEWVVRNTSFGLRALASSSTLSAPSQIYLDITSEGGGAFEAHAIAGVVDDIQRRGGVVIGTVYGFAMSAAIFPLLACNLRRADCNSMVMIHGLVEFKVGDVRSQEVDTEANLKLAHMEAKLLSNRTNKSFEFWLNIMKDDLPHYYTAQEALEIGLIDQVLHRGV